jgi:exopolysaccharide biosynthesis protein
MKKSLQFCFLLITIYTVFCCTKIDYAIIKNDSEDKITLKVNGKLFVDDKKTVFIKQENNFFEYEMKPNTEEFVAEFYNSKFDENVFNFDTLIIISPKRTLQLKSKTEIFNQFKAANKGDFKLIINE